MNIHGTTAHIAMLNGTVDLSAAAATAVRVGTSNLIERKWLKITNASNVNVFIGSSYLSGAGVMTAMTIARLAKEGDKIPPGDMVWYPVSDNITVYAMAQVGAGKRLRIIEFS